MGSVLLGDSRPYTRLCKHERVLQKQPACSLQPCLRFCIVFIHSCQLGALISCSCYRYLYSQVSSSTRSPEKELSVPTRMYCDAFSLKDQHCLLLFSSFLQQQKSFLSLVHRSGCGSLSGYPGNGVSLSVDLIFQLP